MSSLKYDCINIMFSIRYLIELKTIVKNFNFMLNKISYIDITSTYLTTTDIYKLLYLMNVDNLRKI